MITEIMLQDPKVCVCGSGNIGHSLYEKSLNGEDGLGVVPIVWN